ncbi:MAG: hypothetical protein ACXWEW_04775 [Nitrososphaeraceae archaeon]
MEWWGCILDKETRRKYNLKGTFGKKGVSMVGDTISELDDFPLNDLTERDPITTLFSFPFNYPNVIKPKRDNYCIFNSNDNEVTINNETLFNSLLLSISLDKSADNIDSILEEFKSTFCFLQSQRNWDLLNPEIDPTTKVPVSIPYENILEVPESRSLIDIIKDKRKDKNLITKYTSINKWLIALYCYDVYLDKNENLLETADVVIAKIKEFKFDQAINSKTGKEYTKKYNDTTILQYYNDARLNRDNASALLENYLSKA